MVGELNTDISRDESLGSGFCIGHSYFCGQRSYSDEWLKQVVNYDIIPMLNEYWFDNEDKRRKWENKLLGVFDD